jgi:hypothetical protein
LSQELVEVQVVRHLTSHHSWQQLISQEQTQLLFQVLFQVQLGGHTLSTPEIASHTHTLTCNQPIPAPPVPNFRLHQQALINLHLLYRCDQSAGGGGSHSHPFSGSLSSATADVSVTVPAADVKYANVIVAKKINAYI